MDEVCSLDDFELDRRCFNLSASMSACFSWTYGWLGGRLVAPIDPNKFDNASSKIAEIGVRLLIVLGAVASVIFAGTYILLGAVVLSAGSKIFRSLGYYFQKNRMTHMRGSAAEQPLQQGHAKIMEWNIRGHGGGLHYSKGGVVHWSSRLPGIVEAVLKEEPDVIVLQEVYDTRLVEALYAHLEPFYAHFYAHLGANVWGEESGIMVIAKCAIHRFFHTDFTQTEDQVQRSFETLEIKASPDASAPCARILSTQLSPGRNASELRMDQISQILDTLAKEKLTLPTLLVGSLNVDRDNTEESAYLARYFSHSYLDSEPTHSEELKNQWAPIFEGQEESNSYISLAKRTPEGDVRTFPVRERGVRLGDSHLIRGFNKEYDTATATSDHHAVVTELSGLTS
ncbi:MAG: hypothetical protein KGQ49_02295 [Verrucomicrobia bacterium]|nr:hypothetical protein [Verrucomicrobiota bacterium]MBU6446211.1 hypothetical protein [Verrucomicrobiota bacterium]MDE3047850.1 hypothetical protein [Verrucomicrobiota bacterium]